MDNYKCSLFSCIKDKGNLCCAACGDHECMQRCLNDPQRCGLCNAYPRPEIRIPEEREE